MRKTRLPDVFAENDRGGLDHVMLAVVQVDAGGKTVLGAAAQRRPVAFWKQLVYSSFFSTSRCPKRHMGCSIQMHQKPTLFWVVTNMFMVNLYLG